MRVVLVGALLAMPTLAQVRNNRIGNVPHAPAQKQCDQRPRSVLLQPGIHIDVTYCSAVPDITATTDIQEANYDGKFYTIVNYNIHRDLDTFPAYVLIYQPNANWAIPTKSLDSVGAIMLKDGDALDAGHSGWLVQQDSRFNHRGLSWLEARQIVMKNSTTGRWVYYRIILDTRHNLLYVLYVREGKGSANQENSFFDSFMVDAGKITVDTGIAPGAHLPPPYPNP